MSTTNNKDKPRRSAYAAALSLLAMREHSRQQLAQKLAQRDYPETEISDALQQLSDDGYLSDERAFSASVAGGLRRGHGPLRIRAQLREAGLPSDGPITADNETPIDWIAQAKGLAERRFGTDPPNDYKEWARRARFLQSRGFDSETIRRALPHF